MLYRKDQSPYTKRIPKNPREKIPRQRDRYVEHENHQKNKPKYWVRKISTVTILFQICSLHHCDDLCTGYSGDSASRSNGVSPVCQLCVACVSTVCHLCVTCVSPVCHLCVTCVSTVDHDQWLSSFIQRMRIWKSTTLTDIFSLFQFCEGMSVVSAHSLAYPIQYFVFSWFPTVGQILSGSFWTKRVGMSSRGLVLCQHCIFVYCEMHVCVLCDWVNMVVEKNKCISRIFVCPEIQSQIWLVSVRVIDCSMNACNHQHMSRSLARVCDDPPWSLGRMFSTPDQGYRGVATPPKGSAKKCQSCRVQKHFKYAQNLVHRLADRKLESRSTVTRLSLGCLILVRSLI